MPIRRRSSRRPAVPLSRDRILAAALKLVDRHGVERLTMRALGEALSVEAMSLYRYLAGKAELLAGVSDLIQGMFQLPPASVEWQAGLRAIARSVWEITSAHPNVVPLLLATPTDSPAARALAERALELIMRAGITAAEAHRIYRMFQAYTLGSAMMSQASPSDAEVRRFAQRLKGSGEVPLLREALAATKSIDRKTDFEAGLELMLAALTIRGRAPMRGAS